MKLTNFTYTVDADGHALLTWNMADKPMNVINASVMEDISTVIDAVVTDANVKGVIFWQRVILSGG
jgi:3-hydroxyacyl-CoA dehydrogenase / enoyl-CoA hydratase / 3-hydroxybutyryl-CoA epimerase